MSLLCIQVLPGPSFTECCEGAASTARNRTALPEPPQRRGSIKYPCTQCNLQLSGKDSHKTFPHSSLKTFVHQHTEKVNQSLTTAAHTIPVGRNIHTNICVPKHIYNNRCVLKNVQVKHNCTDRPEKLLPAG